MNPYSRSFVTAIGIYWSVTNLLFLEAALPGSEWLNYANLLSGILLVAMGLSPNRILERRAVKLVFGAAVLFLEFEIMVRCVWGLRSFAKIGTGIALEPPLTTAVKTASIIVILCAIGLGLAISAVRLLQLNPRNAEPRGPHAQPEH